MGQKCNPIGLRIGINKTWNSLWFDEDNYAEKLEEDLKIRKFLKTRLQDASVSKIGIERKPKELIISIHTAKPGIVIGRKGQEIEKLKEELKMVFKKNIKIYINEIKRPELDAYLVADNIAKMLEKRVNFRRAMKKALDMAMKANAQGIKVQCSGRLGGADMARTEGYHKGRVPLHTLRSDIDYANLEAHTQYGRLGIKVWICKGEKFTYMKK
ncbi:MAG: 30S ribosomal protein S3 [Candidatus Cloacimonadota bacterium]|nr:MAG: 30S ribosomal protein S3 [Candidatus Cloacimonadota bacterium]PIE79126.1 MAG: 30S ribosomal protein S3 [Candidatus Delongbacteria bacterium]